MESAVGARHCTVYFLVLPREWSSCLSDLDLFVNLFDEQGRFLPQCVARQLVFGRDVVFAGWKSIDHWNEACCPSPLRKRKGKDEKKEKPEDQPETQTKEHTEKQTEEQKRLGLGLFDKKSVDPQSLDQQSFAKKTCNFESNIKGNISKDQTGFLTKHFPDLGSHVQVVAVRVVFLDLTIEHTSDQQGMKSQQQHKFLSDCLKSWFYPTEIWKMHVSYHARQEWDRMSNFGQLVSPTLKSESSKSELKLKLKLKLKSNTEEEWDCFSALFDLYRQINFLRMQDWWPQTIGLNSEWFQRANWILCFKSSASKPVFACDFQFLLFQQIDEYFVDVICGDVVDVIKSYLGDGEPREKNAKEKEEKGEEEEEEEEEKEEEKEEEEEEREREKQQKTKKELVIIEKEDQLPQREKPGKEVKGEVEEKRTASDDFRFNTITLSHRSDAIILLNRSKTCIQWVFFKGQNTVVSAHVLRYSCEVSWCHPETLVFHWRRLNKTRTYHNWPVPFRFECIDTEQTFVTEMWKEQEKHGFLIAHIVLKRENFRNPVSFWVHQLTHSKKASLTWRESPIALDRSYPQCRVAISNVLSWTNKRGGTSFSFHGSLFSLLICDRICAVGLPLRSQKWFEFSTAVANLERKKFVTSVSLDLVEWEIRRVIFLINVEPSEPGIEGEHEKIATFGVPICFRYENPPAPFSLSPAEHLSRRSHIYTKTERRRRPRRWNSEIKEKEVVITQTKFDFSSKYDHLCLDKEKETNVRAFFQVIASNNIVVLLVVSSAFFEKLIQLGLLPCKRVFLHIQGDFESEVWKNKCRDMGIDLRDFRILKWTISSYSLQQSLQNINSYLGEEKEEKEKKEKEKEKKEEKKKKENKKENKEEKKKENKNESEGKKSKDVSKSNRKTTQKGRFCGPLFIVSLEQGISPALLRCSFVLQEIKKHNAGRIRLLVELSPTHGRTDDFFQYEKLVKTLAKHDLLTCLVCSQTPVFTFQHDNRQGKGEAKSEAKSEANTDFFDFEKLRLVPNPRSELKKGKLWCQKEDIVQQCAKKYNGDCLAEFFWREMNLGTLTNYLEYHSFYVRGDMVVATY